MPAPPAREELSAPFPNPSNGVMRAGMGKFYDYVKGLLGSTGNAAEARAALEVPSIESLQNYVGKQGDQTIEGVIDFIESPTVPDLESGAASDEAVNARFVSEAVAQLSLGIVTSRQTVLSGPIDSNGAAAFGGVVGGASLVASGTIVVTAANGWKSRIGSVANPSWSSPSGSGTGYLFLRINVDGTCTPVVRSLAPIYRDSGPDVTTNGQFVFNVQEMVGKVGNGSAANAVWEVCIGQCPFSAGVWTGSATWYALMGRYSSDAFVYASSSSLQRNHNIGVMPRQLRIVLVCMSAVNGYSVGEEAPAITSYNNGVADFGVAGSLNALVSNVQVAANGAAVLARPSGSNVVANPANWRIKIYCDRGF